MGSVVRILTARPPRHAPGRVGVLCAAAAAIFACAEETRSGDSLRLGVLLPYTGEAAETGAALERSLLMVTDQVNEQHGGVGGRHIELIFRDTHGEAPRAAAGLEEQLAEGVVALLGPGGDEEVPGVAAALGSNGQALVLSPLAASGDAGTASSADPWFRLAPHAALMGEAFAKELQRRGRLRVGVIVGSDAYHGLLAAAFADEMLRLGGTLDLVESAADGSAAGSLANRVVEASRSGTQGFLLALNPLPAARFVNEVGALTGAAVPQWYLSPRLKTDVFIYNTIPEAVEGGLGIAASVFLEDRAPFIAAFQARWPGAMPVDSTYFAYDAAALLCIALDRMAVEGGSGRAALAEAVRQVAQPGGLLVGWNELDLAFARNREASATSRKVQYAGVTGPIRFLDDGARELGRAAYWEIDDGKIVDIESNAGPTGD